MFLVVRSRCSGAHFASSDFMKVLGSFLTTILTAMILTLPNLGPLHEVRVAWLRRAQVIQSLLMGFVATVFILVGFIMAVVDAAVQYDQGERVAWNTVMFSAAGFFLVGLLTLGLARGLWPLPAASKEPGDSIESQLLMVLHSVLLQMQQQDIEPKTGAEVGDSQAEAQKKASA